MCENIAFFLNVILNKLIDQKKKKSIMSLTVDIAKILKKLWVQIVVLVQHQVTLNVNGLDDVQVNMQKQGCKCSLMYGLHARLLSNAVDRVV